MYFFNPGSNKSYVTPNGEVLHPFEFNNPIECGVRVLNTSSVSHGQWKLTGIDQNGNLNSDYFQVYIRSESDDDANSCPSSNPVGYCSKIELSTGRSKTCGETLTENHICEYLLKGQMEKNSIMVELNSETPQKYRKDSERTILECSKEPEWETMKSCYIEHIPSGEVYNIEEGLQDVRYSAYKTDFQAGICQFEIPGSIEEHEAGVWKMHIERNLQYNNGRIPPLNRTCTFHLIGNETLAKEKLLQRTQSTVLIKTISDNVLIDCAKNVYYPLTICYLRQDNLVHFYDDHGEMLMGNCIFTVWPGNWTCGFNGPTKDDPDFVQNFEIIKYDSEIIEEQMKRTAKGTITLECHHISQATIKTCLFLSPNGKMYRLPSDNYNSTQFSYNGRGFTAGDCGIELSKEIEEPGNWSCIVQKTSNEQMLSVDIWVDE